jgi:phosphotransferase system HPr (HPr) family protein
MFTMEVTVSKGLTARNAVTFVQEANKFHSQVKVKKGDSMVVDAKSILGVMTLSLQKGNQMVIEAQGQDEREAVHALIKIVDGAAKEENQWDRETFIR